MYSKERKGMNLDQAVENVNAVLGSDYFRTYDFNGAKISSDLVNVDLKRGFGVREVLKITDITDTFANLLQIICKRGTLEEVSIILGLSEETLRDMQFEKRLYKEDLELPLNVSVRKEGTTKNFNYRFSVLNYGLKESYFESEGLDFKSARAKVSRWYGKVTKNLKRILPHEVSEPIFTE